MPTDWTIEGEYVEACNCSLPCQCLWFEPPDDDVCTAAVFWAIDEGHFGDVSLDGLTAGMLLYDEGVLFEGGWDVVLVLDEAADDRQLDALETVFLGEAGGMPSALAGFVEEVRDVVSAPISVSASDGEVSLSAGDVVSIATEERDGLHEEPGRVSPHPLLPPSMEAGVGQSTDATVEYGEEFSWDVAGNNAYLGEFAFGNA